jgi:hypothetical protein
MAQAFRFGPNGIALQFSAKADVEVNVALPKITMILSDAVTGHAPNK